MSADQPSITTFVGDAGTTFLYSGEEVPKDSPRPMAYGTVDELVSLLGLARCHCTKPATHEAVLYVQRMLFRVAAELATTPAGRHRLKHPVDHAMMAELEERRSVLEAATTLPKGFIVPGGELAPAHLDLARAMARRAERHVVSLFTAGEISNPLLLKWMNRLSDYLYLLARAEETRPLLVNDL